MGELVKRVLMWALGAAIGRIITGVGLSIISYSTLNYYLHDYLNQMVASLQGLESDVLNIVLMAGVSDAIGIIGSAALARMTVTTAASALGFRLTQ